MAQTEYQRGFIDGATTMKNAILAGTVACKIDIPKQEKEAQ